MRWGDAYEIGEIDCVPFKQYAAMLALPEPPEKTEPPDERTTNAPEVQAVNAADSVATAFGIAEIEIPDNTKPGAIILSDEIPHGLGFVPSAITLGLSDGGGAVFGDASVFGGKNEFDYAAQTRDNDGTFRIGVRVNTRVSARTLTFVWSAVSQPDRFTGVETEAIRIIVNPSVKRLMPREKLRFMAEPHGLPDNAEIVWTVREQNGGDFTSAGEYTAPAEPGVYTINARYEEVFGTALVVVQEPHQGGA